MFWIILLVIAGSSLVATLTTIGLLYVVDFFRDKKEEE